MSDDTSSHVRVSHLYDELLSYKDAVIPARDTIFLDFCDDNICACAVSTLILLWVANFSPEMDSATAISYIRREHFAFKPTFNSILSKLVKNRKLNYAHARKSFAVVSSKELVLGKMNRHTKFDNKCLANAKRPCDCSMLCLRPRSSLCSCAHCISEMTSFGCRDQDRDSVCPVL